MAIYELAMVPAIRASRSRARTAALAGVRDSAPVLGVIAPLGLLVGTTVAESPVANGTGWFGAAMVYAASAHLVAVSLLSAGASAVAVVTAVLLINARGMVYSAGLASALRGQPKWFRWAGPYLLIDPLFALTAAHAEGATDGEPLRWHYLGAGLAMWLVWMPAVALGILVGPALPDIGSLTFAVPLIFIGFLVPGINGRTAVIAAAAAGVIATLSVGLPGGVGLLVGTAAGMVATSLSERTRS